MATIDPQQLRALISTVVRADDPRSVVAVRFDGSWSWPEVLEGPTPIRVQVCVSPLAVRAAIADRIGNQVLAVLTPCSDHELGPDVLARVAKGRVLTVDPFSAVLALFDATVLDPALTREERWLVDDLIEIAPPFGWSGARPPNGLLDVDRAWDVWHSYRFAGRAVPIDLVAVLDFVADPAVAHLLNELG
ncbi:MAG: PglZ domain protein, partial [Aeromicrobium sp.]|nr:PglZ domain protein [Aeromicrobium sp.]